MYPRIEINLNHIEMNLRKINEICQSNDIEVAVVTKLVCGHPTIIKVLADIGVDWLADSRIENIISYAEIQSKTMMLRLPMKSQVEDVVRYCSSSLISDVQMATLLNDVALKVNKVHQVIVMVDLGDLREGILDRNELLLSIKKMKKLPGIELLGIGTNLSCFGGVRPTQLLLKQLVDINDTLKQEFDLELPIVSGGNSGTLSLLVNEGKLPEGINHLRLGASVFMGIGLDDRPIPGLRQDTFKLVCEVIELRNKPSVPIGDVGLDAFGNKPTFEDKGNILRCICAIGRQDVSPSDLIPCDPGIEILGASSDHLLLDVTTSRKSYKIGETVEFNITYAGCLSLMTSVYVSKKFVHNEIESAFAERS